MTIPNDKAEHFLIGLIISISVGWFHPIAGWVVASISGLAKEWWDKQGHGTYDVKDYLSTSTGGLVGMVITAAIRPLFM